MAGVAVRTPIRIAGSAITGENSFSRVAGMSRIGIVMAGFAMDI